jgi:hypothetical protein
MSNIRKYLASAQNRAHESFLNADGFFDSDLSFTASEDFMSADGNDMGAGSPTSQPYIIQISNTGSATSNFDVLGSYEYINNNGFTTGGSLVLGTTTISSATPNVTYQQMLYQFMNNPFSVGLTYIQSASSTQLLEVISVQTKDANGNLAQKPLVPTIDPYQQQTTVLAMRYGYRIDGYTKLILNQILASTTVKLYLFPSDNINLARGLSGNAVSRQFGSPGIVRSQPVKLVG